MRAVCEQCGAAQPPDWKAGDLCGACGAAARRDVRCFWCAKWTPLAKFCRSCGAAVVEETHYGAARMLKEAGTDRFTVPKMLREIDPDQIENFTRIYQRHAAAVARHVDELRFLERFLHHRTFSDALHETLIPQLPWPEEALAKMSTPSHPPGDDLATARLIGERTPFAATKSLSALVRLRLGDGEAYRDAARAFLNTEPALRAETALVLTGWRLWATFGRPRENLREIVQELQNSPFKLEAAVRLALLGQADESLLREALGSPDSETSFAAALALGDVDRLQTALQGDNLEKSTAGSKLIQLGVLKAVEQVIEKSPIEVQTELVESVLRRKEPVPELAETLLEIVEKTADERLRERAARALCRQLRPAWALRIAKAAGKDRHIFQSLLSEEAGLPPEDVARVAGHMIDTGIFGMHQYGLKEAGARGAIPDGFVPAQFGRGDEELRKELLSLAEVQLGERGDETLHRFVMNVVFGPYPAETRAAAWWVLHRGYRQGGEYRGEGPFKLSKAPIVRFFGSVGRFLPRLAAVLRDPATLKEVGLYDFLATLFGEADPELLPELAAEEAAGHDLLQAVLEAAKGDYWPGFVDGLIKFAGLAGAFPRWRDEAIAGLKALDKKGNYHWEKSLRILRMSAHGLPDESEWSKLPDDVAPSRFAAAGDETRALLLKVADQQLIHKPSEAVGRFLLDVAFGPYADALRLEAMGIFDDRASRLVKATMKDVLPGLAETLRRPTLLQDRGFRDFLEEILKEAEPPGGGPLAEALIELAGRSGERELHNLRLYAIRLLGKATQGKDVVVAGLRALLERKGYDFGSEVERALHVLAPPAPEPPPEAAVHAPPAANPWEAKQKEAERLGRELQEAVMTISFGTDAPAEKTRRIMALQAEFQARIKQLYG